MSDRLLLVVPLTPAALFALLSLSVLVEQRVLLAPAVVRSALRSRRATPEHTEAIVAAEFRRMLDESS